jgi:hypothetical protein
MYRYATLLIVMIAIASCGKSSPKQPMLPDQQARWVQSIRLSDDSIVKYVGKTKELLITQSTAVTTFDNVKSISFGEVINGVEVGAIRCTFFPEDALSGNEQYMWRGRWGCQAGRNEHEITHAVRDDGTKVFDYIYISPVTLD